MSQAVGSITSIEINSGDEAELLRLIAAMRDELKEMEGIVYFDFYRSTEDEHRFVVLERYQDEAAHQRFLNSSVAKTYFPQFRRLAVQVSVSDYVAV